MNEYNVIQKVLRNEWVIISFVAGSLWFCVTTIVLPLQKLQIQVADIQADLKSQSKQYDALSNTLNATINRVTAVEVRLNILEKQHGI